MFPEMHASIRGVMPLESWAFIWSGVDDVERRSWMVGRSLFRTASWSGSSVDVEEVVMADDTLNSVAYDDQPPTMYADV